MAFRVRCRVAIAQRGELLCAPDTPEEDSEKTKTVGKPWN